MSRTMEQVNVPAATADPAELAGPPPIAGLRLRAFRDAADYETMADLARRANLADEEDWLPDAANKQADFEHTEDLVPERDVFIAELDGVAVASSNVNRQVRDGMAVYAVFGTVAPEWRRRGIGRWLLRHNEAQSRIAATRHEDPNGRVLGTWAGERGGARELLLSEGYAEVRFGFTMRRPTLDDIPDAELPHGLEIRDVRREDLRRIWQADDEAFRDHWGHREQGEEDFQRLLAMPELDTSLWSVAWDGDEVAGSVQSWIWRTENEGLGVRRGWLEHISVRRPWRRRGLARAIIADSLRRLRAAGMDEAMLGVDAENPTGALGLYESMGFVVKDRGATYRKAWEPGGRLF
jgi:mycothiol synthase